MASNTKPIMLLDVDGPLNPFASKPSKRPGGYTMHTMSPDNWYGPPLPVLLNHSHGEKLMDCGYDIVWATAWEDQANEWISPHIGLPTDLPYIKWESHRVYKSIAGTHGLFYKTPQIQFWMGMNYPDRPYIWIDDEAGRRDEKYLTDAPTVPLKIFKIDPINGLQDEHFDQFKEWRVNL